MCEAHRFEPSASGVNIRVMISQREPAVTEIRRTVKQSGPLSATKTDIVGMMQH